MKTRRIVCTTACVAAGALAAHLHAIPDVTYRDVTSQSNHGVVGTIRAYSLGTSTCNMGNTVLTWASSGTPGVGFNLYRLQNGRLMQIGLGFVKTACCAASGSGCGVTCTGGGGGLGAGCMDVYGSSWNAGQNWLAPRSAVNAFTGGFSGFSAATGNAIFKRIQVQQNDLSTAMFPGAQYFVEGVYVASDETHPAGAMNNASYRRVTIDQTTFNIGFQSTMQVGIPAIQAWRDNGLGPGIVDPSVTINTVDVLGEGRYYVGSKVTDNGDGSFRYDYAVFNLNSDRSGGSFTVPVPDGVQVTAVGYNAPFYHSGEIYNNASWTWTTGGGQVRWSSPESFDQNPNSNALRWGTTYSYWFTANAPPVAGTATLGLFKPFMPTSVTANVPVPGLPPCTADVNGDSVIDGVDIGIVLAAWSIPPTAPGCGGTLPCPADFNNDGHVDGLDIGILLSQFGPCAK